MVEGRPSRRAERAHGWGGSEMGNLEDSKQLKCLLALLVEHLVSQQVHTWFAVKPGRWV